MLKLEKFHSNDKKLFEDKYGRDSQTSYEICDWYDVRGIMNVN